jgi:hypothetical protein
MKAAPVASPNSKLRLAMPQIRKTLQKRRVEPTSNNREDDIRTSDEDREQILLLIVHCSSGVRGRHYGDAGWAFRQNSV